MQHAELGEGEHERQLDLIIAEYLQAFDEGRPVDQAEVLRQHPEFVAELREFFVDAGQIEMFALPPSPEPDETRTASDLASMLWRPGTRVRYFGDYEILDELGVGGMGVVYKGRQTKLNKIIAIKMIKAGHLAGDGEVRRFRAEARAAAKLDHPGIVPVHEVGVDHGQHYYTMDYVGGGSLSKLHRDEPVAARRAAEIIKQMAEAMHYAHGQGIVHRDLKPANVLLTADGVPRITDLGLAKRLWSEDDSVGVSMTETGQILGTVGYMAPEQAAGKTRLVGPLADIYGLGAVLYALLTSRAPFLGESQADTILQVINKEPVPLRVLNPSIPRDLETVCLKCLEKEPHKRYGTSQQLAEDLARFLDNKPMSTPLRVVVIKPSKYLPDGFVERFRWGFMPNSTAPHVRSMTPTRVAEATIEVHAVDEYVHTELDYLSLLEPNEVGRTLVALVGVQSHQFHRALDLAAYARKNGCMTVIGGPHVMTCDTSVMHDRGVSFAQAEAELIWSEILHDAAQGELQPVYGRDQRWQQELQSPTLVPPSRRDLDRYIVPMLGVYPARGCPFLCNFCSVIKIAGRRIRSQSIDTTLASLRAAKAAGVRTIMFTSDNFNKYPEAGTLLEAMVEEQLGLQFFVQCDTQIARQESLVAHGEGWLLSNVRRRRVFRPADAACRSQRTEPS